MNERDKYIRIYSQSDAADNQPELLPGKMGGGYGRICWGENMLEPLKKWKASSLLDVGCGYGNFCDAATLFVPKVYGLDIASVATGKVIDNPEITYFDGEAKNLPLPSLAVEWITSFDCLEHCLEEDIDIILDEFNRVASKGFVLSISYEACEIKGMPLHMTVKPSSWWINKLKKYGDVTQESRAPITGVPYLVCRKPVVPKVICYCAGGLGKRLRSMTWAERWRRQTGRDLTLLWLTNDPHCRIDFSALFSASIPEITEKELLELPSCKIYANVKAVADQALINGGQCLRSAVQKWGSSDYDELSEEDPQDNIVIYHPDCRGAVQEADILTTIEKLKPVKPIMHKIRELASHLGIDKALIGVHARGTDFGIDVDAYASQMEKAIQRNPVQKFLVCSDEKPYVEELVQRFRQHVVTRSRSAWHRKTDPHKPWFSDNIETTSHGIIEDLIDLYLLALTDFQIYHESSDYAQIGYDLSKHPRTLLIGSTTDHPSVNSNPIKSLPRQSENKSLRYSHTNNPGAPHISTPWTIYYFCPDIQSSSAGMRRLYRHVSFLHNQGYSASILHEKSGFKLPDMPKVPLSYLDKVGQNKHTIFVIPEGMPRIMNLLKDHPGRRFVIALNWHYIFSTLPDGIDWRHMNIERVMVVSPTIGKMVSWSMGLPSHLLQSSIDHQRYYAAPKSKQPQICFIERKATHTEKLKRLLGSKNKDYINKINWLGIDGVSQDQYASEIRKSSVFLSTSMAEGFPTSFLEAMAAGTIAAGYDAIGGKDILIGEGSYQNCVLAPNGDYLTLAYALAPLLDDIISGRMDKWYNLIANAQSTASKLTVENEALALIAFWRQCFSGKIMDTYLNPMDSLSTRKHMCSLRDYRPNNVIASERVQTL